MRKLLNASWLLFLLTLGLQGWLGVISWLTWLGTWIDFKWVIKVACNGKDRGLRGISPYLLNFCFITALRFDRSCLGCMRPYLCSLHICSGLNLRVSSDTGITPKLIIQNWFSHSFVR